MNRLKNASWASKTLLAVVAACLLFQGVHFLEHLFQVTAWVIGDKTKPFMTTWATWMIMGIGRAMEPASTMTRQHQIGMEVLHLIGNGIFLVGTIGLWRLFPTRKTKWAAITEGLHFYEHVSLTVSAIALGKAIGMSTFFGVPVAPMTLVAYRVWWHFIANLIPSLLALSALDPFVARLREAYARTPGARPRAAAGSETKKRRKRERRPSVLGKK